MCPDPKTLAEYVIPNGMWMAFMASACLIPVGCGTPLADGTYRGRALYSVEGPLLVADFEQLGALAVCQEDAEVCTEAALTQCDAEDDDIDEDMCAAAERCYADLDACLAGEGPGFDVFTSEIALGVTLVWSDPTGDGEPFEQPSTIEPGLPARYRLTIYQPPPPSTLYRTEGGDFAVAVLVAFEDIDGDGALDPDRESVLGGTAELAILYTPGGVDAPALGRYGPGFHRVVPDDGWCESPDEARFFAPDEAQSPITFGRLDEIAPALLPDLDCRDGLSEWGLCPSDAELDQCDEARPPLYCAFCDVDEDDGDEEPDDRAEGAAE